VGAAARRSPGGERAVTRETLDRRVVAWQLGRTPRGFEAVCVRCPYGFPQVVSVPPVIDGEPFPTTFWLTCPHLAVRVSRVEAAGGIHRMEERLRRDARFAARYADAHRAAIAERTRRLSPRDRARLAASGRLDALLRTGVAGLSDRSRVKCLHAHVAHALASENPVGEAVLELIPDRACPPQQVICSAASAAEQIGQPSSC